MKSLVYKIFLFFGKHRKLLITTLVATILLLTASIYNLQFNEDAASFLPNTKDNQRINYASQHIGISDKIYVTVSQQDSTTNQEAIYEAIEYFVENLRSNDTLNHIKSIDYFADPQKFVSVTNFVTSNLPLYLSDSDYLRIDSLIEPDAIRKQLANNKSMLLTPMSSSMKGMISSDPLFFSTYALKQLSELQMTGSYQISNGYIFNKDGSEGIVIIATNYPGSETIKNKQLVANIQNAATNTEKQIENIKINFTGVATAAITNANQIKKDSIFSSVIAIILILTVLGYFFKNFRVLLTIVFPIAFGAIFAFAFLAIFREQISIIAIGAGSIMLGIAVNYPLHFLAHLQQGYSKKQTIKDIVSPLVTGNITTVGAFLSLVFISSDAMCDLGIFASTLLIGTIIFVLIFLPHLVNEKLFRKQNLQEKLQFRWFANFNPEGNKYIVLAIVLITIPLYFFSKNTSFETNMMAINYMTDEEKRLNEELLASTDSKNPVVYCVAEGTTYDQALINYEKAKFLLDSLQQENIIIRKTGINNLLLSKQQQKIKIDKWNKFWQGKKEIFVENFLSAAAEQGFSEKAFSQFLNTIETDFAVQELEHFEPILANYAGNFVSIEDNKTLIYTLLETKEEHKDAVSNRIDNYDKNIFTFTSRSILTKMVEALSKDFDLVLYVCALIVFVFLTISFGRLELSLLTFIPLAIGWIWILGIMNICDMKFNIVNIILATFIFGQGDDYAIFVTEGLMYEHAYRRKMLASYKNSILLSAILMFIGIGALIIAKHPAMKSLAEVTIVGMLVVVLMAFVLPPLIYRWLTTKKGNQRTIPVTFFGITKALCVLFVLLVGSTILSVWGFFLLTIGGKTQKHKLKFHKIVQQTMIICAKIIPQINYKIENPQNENFEKPAIIICNHQSHLDLLYTLLLNPKIIVLTKKYVWRAPIYGWILRYADYYPVHRGIEEVTDLLEKKIAEGYSVMIFPEGTRSDDCTIKRFHQGAFYLADKLGLDILPIITHGIGHAMPKEAPILRKAKVTIKILPRIIAGDKKFHRGEDAKIVAKAFRKLYIEEYQALKQENETPDYNRELVLQNYYYKGANIERTAKQNFRKHFDEYAKQIMAIPEKSCILVKNCGQGEFSLLAALSRKDLQITATDKDEFNILLARNCFSVPENLHYVEHIEDEKSFDKVIDLAE